MKYINYIKYERLLEGLNSARQKFDETEDEFETLKALNPTNGTKWKYMDFIVKIGYHDDLKELLKNFEQLSNKGIINDKNVNNYFVLKGKTLFYILGKKICHCFRQRRDIQQLLGRT